MRKSSGTTANVGFSTSEAYFLSISTRHCIYDIPVGHQAVTRDGRVRPVLPLTTQSVLVPRLESERCCHLLVQLRSPIARLVSLDKAGGTLCHQLSSSYKYKPSSYCTKGTHLATLGIGKGLGREKVGCTSHSMNMARYFARGYDRIEPCPHELSMPTNWSAPSLVQTVDVHGEVMFVSFSAANQG